MAQRAKVVLLVADAVPVKEIVERVGVSKPTGSSVTASCPTESRVLVADRPPMRDVLAARSA